MKQVFLIFAFAFFVSCSQDNSTFFEEENLIKAENNNLQTRAADGNSENDIPMSECWEIWCEIGEIEEQIRNTNRRIQAIYDEYADAPWMPTPERMRIEYYEIDLWKYRRDLRRKNELYVHCVSYSNME